MLFCNQLMQPKDLSSKKLQSSGVAGTPGALNFAAKRLEVLCGVFFKKTDANRSDQAVLSG